MKPILKSCSIILVFLFSSCTTLQWRESDAEIKKRFIEKKIATDVSYVTIDSLDLSIRIQKLTKPENKINIVFLHGSPSSLSAWNGYLEDTTLLKKANLYAIDRPGYGYSNFGKEMVSIEKQGAIMSALINDLKIDNVVAVGSSYGGPLVARMAAINSKIKGVIMISPAIDPAQEKNIWASRLTQWWLTRWLVPTGYRVAGDEKTVHAQELALIESDWSNVVVPVIHIHGDEDDIVPYGNTTYTAQMFSNIEIVTTPNTGHEIAWGRPDLIKPYLFKMIDKISE